MTRAKQSIPKITKPALTGISSRTHLFRRLDETHCRHSIVWVSAPAGSGKTTLAASYLRARRRPCLWYQIDARDADPAAFFYYLREAVGRLAPRRHEALPLLTPEYALGLAAYARNFFEGAGARVPAGTVLVLDNYHDLSEDAPLQSLLPPALSALPDGVLVLSRSAPPPPFARLIAEGAIGFLEADELNLSAEETRALARARVGKRIAAGAANALRAQTGGWVAGTVLMLEAPARTLPARRGAETAEQQVLFDYFAAEIFDRAPRETQRLLLATALLPQVDVSAAEALAVEPRAGEILGDLVRRNYFTLRLAGARPRYRYHQLFREFLLARAKRTFDPSNRRALAERAAEILVNAGSPDDAAAILAGAGASEQLAQLVRAHAPALARQGRLVSVEGWLRALPAAVVEGDPWLSYWLGVCRVAVPTEARTHFERAYRTFKEHGDVSGTLVSWAGFVGTFFYVWNDFWALDPWVAEMEELHGTLQGFPSVEVEAQVTFGMLASLMWRAPAHPHIGYWVDRAVALLDSGAAPERRMQLATYLVLYRLTWKGDSPGAHQLLARMRPLLAERDVRPLTEMLWYVMEATCEARVAHVAACLTAVERGLATASRTGILGLSHLLALQGVYGALAQGDIDTARRYHAKAREFLCAGEKLNNGFFHHLGAWIELCAGDIARAEEHARTSLGYAPEAGADLGQPWGEHTLAHVLLERGCHDEAVALLGRSLLWSRTTGNPAMEHHCLLSLAFARIGQGREPDAMDWLRQGLRIGREHGYLAQPWIGWRRDVMSRLAALALEHDIEPEHVRALIQALRLVAPDSAAALDKWPWPIQIRMLGAFELWRNGQRVAFAGKVQRRPLDLLRGIVALGGAGVREEALVDLLWPDAEGDAAAHALETTAYRLRKLLGSPGVVVQQDRCISLDPQTCWVDALALSRQLGRAISIVERAQVDADEVRREADRMLALYRGPLVPAGEDGHDCAEAMRDRLRAQLTRFLHAAARHLSRAGEPQIAAAYLARACEADPGLASAIRAVVIA